MKYAVPLMILTVAAVAAPALAGQKSYTVTGFDRITAANHVEVIYRQGPYAIQVSEPNNRFDELVLKVEGSTLVVARQSQTHWGLWWNDEDLTRFTVTVTAPRIEAVRASSHARVSGDFNAPGLHLDASSHAVISGAFTTDSADVSATSHADVRGSLNAAHVRLDASSHANVKLSGACSDLALTASSHADIESAELRCESARLAASSHADVEAYASRSARGEATSHASVVVRGDPADVRLSASSHGSVRRL